MSDQTDDSTQAAPTPAEHPPTSGWRAIPRAIRWSITAVVVAIALGVVGGVILLLVSLGQSVDGGPDAAAAPPPTSEVVAKARRSTLLVQTKGRRGYRATGSGVVLDEKEGLVVTNFHVVNGGTSFRAGANGSRKASLVAAAPCDDLALLRVKAEDLRSMPLARQDSLQDGEQVLALGYPLNSSTGSALTTTSGVVSSARTRLDVTNADTPTFGNMVQTDAALNPGNSGGPLLDRDGALVGVNTTTVTEVGGQPVDAQGYAIGVDRMREVVDYLRRGQSVGWPGVGIAPVSQRFLSNRNLPTGIVTLGTMPTERAGRKAPAALRQPLLIVEVNGRKISRSLRSYCEAAYEIQSGTRAKLKVFGSTGRPRTISVPFR